MKTIFVYAGIFSLIFLTGLQASPDTLKTASIDFREKYVAAMTKSGPLQKLTADLVPMTYIEELERQEAMLDALKATSYAAATLLQDPKAKARAFKMCENFAALSVDEIDRIATHALAALEIAGRKTTPALDEAYATLTAEIKLARSDHGGSGFL